MNINYKGVLAPGKLDKSKFQKKIMPPAQKILKLPDGGCMLVFPSGKFRVMGLKKPISSYDKLPLLPSSMTMQSATLIANYGEHINLSVLATDLTSRRCI